MANQDRPNQDRHNPYRRRPEWDSGGWEDREPRQARHEDYPPDSDAYRRDDRYDEPRSFQGRRRDSITANANLGGYPYDPSAGRPYEQSSRHLGDDARRNEAYRRVYGQRPDPGPVSHPDYEPDRYVPNPRDGRGDDDGRGFWRMAGDEVASWFGDRGAERRREWDHQHVGRGPKGYKRTDARIHEDINDRLTEDPYIDASDVEVVVAAGEVTLNGLVEDRSSKRRAEDLTERVSGVDHVQNNLRVRPRPGPAADI